MPEVVVPKAQLGRPLASGDRPHRAPQTTNRTGKAMAQLDGVEQEYGQQESQDQQERSLRPPQAAKLQLERQKRVRQHLEKECRQERHQHKRQPVEQNSLSQCALNLGIDKLLATLSVRHGQYTSSEMGARMRNRPAQFAGQNGWL